MAVFIALGSNLGDREAHIKKALAPLMDNPPYGLVDQQNFLNTVVQVETTLAPYALLRQLLDIEKQMGHVRTRRWGPRIIDLDIVLYDSKVIDEPELCIPHRDMANRDFVLAPLVALAPQALHPLMGQTVAQLWKQWQNEHKEQ